ncbi:AI-2E family transporter [Timonella sp. A28]|uniref:AI-2E family transporter n=1 Tax=Timonella sp. A28 TaxID=3442640 RepID=UPI003EC0ECDE
MVSDSSTPRQNKPVGETISSPEYSDATVRVTSSTLKQTYSAKPREHQPYVSPTLVAAAAWGWRFLVVLVVGFVLIKFLGYVQTIVIPVAIALLITVLLQPFERFLRFRLKFPKGLSAVVSLVFLISAISGLIAVAGSQISAGISELSGQAIRGFNELIAWLQGAPLNLDLRSFDQYWSSASQNLQQYTGTVLDGALTFTTTVGHVVAGLLITIFCTIFFLIDGRQIWTWVVGLLPRHVRERTHQAGRRGLVTLASYVRTQILVAFIDSVGIGLGAWAMGLPLVVPMAALVFLGAFIPFVGAIVTGAIAVLVALVVKGWVMALVMLGIVLLVQQIEGHVLQPFLIGRAVALHPVAILLSVTAGTVLAGIVGALFAVPIVAVLNTVILYLNGHDKFPELGFDDHIAMRPVGRRAVMVTSAVRYVSDTTRTETSESEDKTSPTLEKFLSRFQNRNDEPATPPTDEPNSTPTPDGPEAGTEK